MIVVIPDDVVAAGQSAGAAARCSADPGTLQLSDTTLIHTANHSIDIQHPESS